MNRQYANYKGMLPLKVDSFYYDDEESEYFAEYDGWHFTGKTAKSVMNKILRHVFNGGEE